MRVYHLWQSDADISHPEITPVSLARKAKKGDSYTDLSSLLKYRQLLIAFNILAKPVWVPEESSQTKVTYLSLWVHMTIWNIPHALSANWVKMMNPEELVFLMNINFELGNDLI